MQSKTIAQKITVKSNLLSNKKRSTKLKMSPQVTFQSWMKMKKGSTNQNGETENFKKDQMLNDAIGPKSIDHITLKELKKSSLIDENAHKDIGNSDLDNRHRSPSDHLKNEKIGPKQSISDTQNTNEVFQNKSSESEKRPYLFKKDKGPSHSEQEKHLTRSIKEEVDMIPRDIPVTEQGQQPVRLDDNRKLVDHSKYDPPNHVRVTNHINHESVKTVRKFKSQNETMIESKKDSIDEKFTHRLEHSGEGNADQTSSHVKEMGKPTLPLRKTVMRDEINQVSHPNEGPDGKRYQGMNQEIVEYHPPSPLLKEIKKDVDGLILENRLNKTKEMDGFTLNQTEHSNREITRNNLNLVREDKFNNFSKEHVIDNKQLNCSSILKDKRIPEEKSFVNGIEIDSKSKIISNLSKSSRVNEDRASKKIDTQSSQINVREPDKNETNLNHENKKTYEKSTYLHSEDIKNILSLLSENRTTKKTNEKASLQNSVQSIPYHDETMKHQLNVKDLITDKQYPNLNQIVGENRFFKTPSMVEKETLIEHREQTFFKQKDVRFTDYHSQTMDKKQGQNTVKNGHYDYARDLNHRLMKSQSSRLEQEQGLKITHKEDQLDYKKSLFQLLRGQTSKIEQLSIHENNPSATTNSVSTQIDKQNKETLGVNLLNEKAVVKEGQKCIQAHSVSSIQMITGSKQDKLEDARQTYSPEKSSQKDVRFTEFHSQTMDRKQGQNTVKNGYHDHSSNLKHGFTRSQTLRLEQEQGQKSTHKEDQLDHKKSLFQSLHGQTSKIEQLSIHENNPSATTNSVSTQINDKLVAWLENSHVDLKTINSQELIIKLNPSHLGTIHIVLNQDENGLSANIFSESDGTKKLLQSGIHELKDILMSNDIVVHELHVLKHEPNEYKPTNQENFNQNFSEERNREQQKRRHKKSQSSQVEIETWQPDFHDFLVKEV
ncbi:hypothetical protein GMB86_09695 [Terrilactibacillus sp. BCM23-1]|uniref:Flagellar hook-length control protein-like C-terminal domain-containing protein n=1 Tax=Terrilactibacillus tamarindi TaxID=2599694 RepID=A0A6N8CVG4_9BACI|nr:flagellar hook-length control protein FliK [Terrilactibacillus tamarindi]MTT32276.1 hypothetical protein [Terrilactibacillus tamarindi]